MRPSLVIGLTLGAIASAGCYTLEPARGVTPSLGKMVAFDVNDAGRVALGGQMGPAILQVEGRLVQKDSDTYVVAVSSVRLLQGGEQTWTGEQVRIKSQWVSSVYERRLSVARSVALTAVGVGIVGYIAARGIIGSVPSDRPITPGDTGQTARRPARP